MDTDPTEQLDLTEEEKAGSSVEDNPKQDSNDDTFIGSAQVTTPIMHDDTNKDESNGNIADKGNEGTSDKNESKSPNKKRTASHNEEEEGILNSGRKRERKSVGTFQPEDFKDESAKNTFANLVVRKGRGEKLEMIPMIKENIESSTMNDPILAALHKFIFGGPGGAKGAVPKKLIKPHLLEFSGYLMSLDQTKSTKDYAKGVEAEATV